MPFLMNFFLGLQRSLIWFHTKEILRSRLYVSELWVQTDKSLNTLNPKLENFAKRLTSLIVGHNHHPISFETYWYFFLD